MNNNLNQLLFISLIKQYGNGNHTTFRNIVNLAYPNFVNIPYLYTNLYLAANVAGLIDIHNIGSILKWNSAINNNSNYIKIGSAPCKLIGANIEFAKDYGKSEIPLIVDHEDRCLITGFYYEEEENPSKEDIFNEEFFEKLIDYSEIEKIACFEERHQPDLSGKLEIYNYKLKKWDLIEETEINNPSLIRVYGEFSGANYYIIDPKLNLYFKVKYPEWAFLISAIHLGWNKHNFIKSDFNSITVDRTFILPSLLLRFLFSSSQSLTIGRNLVFSSINKRKRDLFFNYLDSIWGNHP